MVVPRVNCMQSAGCCCYAPAAAAAAILTVCAGLLCPAHSRASAEQAPRVPSFRPRTKTRAGQRNGDGFSISFLVTPAPTTYMYSMYYVVEYMCRKSGRPKFLASNGNNSQSRTEQRERSGKKREIDRTSATERSGSRPTTPTDRLRLLRAGHLANLGACVDEIVSIVGRATCGCNRDSSSSFPACGRSSRVSSVCGVLD
jgi:hypothetical protein